MRAYPELRSGRFAVIADLEDSAQMELFELESPFPTQAGKPAWTRGHAETGSSCVSMTFGRPDDELVVRGSHAGQWYFKRDWRTYDLLLLSMEVPTPSRRSVPEPLLAEVTVHAGADVSARVVHTHEELRPGWNTLRFDLADLADRIPLDDVRELRLRVLGMSKPLSVKLDDIILTSNREDLWGDSSGGSGALYVQRAGRGWNVGAAGRFEFRVSNGQFVRAHNLMQDPLRAENLLSGGSLGPNPEFLDGQVEATSAGVSVRSEIVEMSAVRVVIALEWRATDTGSPPREPSILSRWVYTIYPTGQIYVEVSRSESSTERTGPLLFNVPGMDAPNENVNLVNSGSGDGTHGNAPAFAVRRTQSEQTALLFVPALTDGLVQSGDISRDARWTHLSATVQPMEDRPCTFHFFLATSQVSDQELSDRAIGYAAPPLPIMELGRFLEFDHADGSYVLEPDEGRLRFLWDGVRNPTFSPMFRVRSGPSSKEAWVYVNHRIHHPIALDHQGNLLFQIAEKVGQTTLVEVLFRSSEQSHQP